MSNADTLYSIGYNFDLELLEEIMAHEDSRNGVIVVSCEEVNKTEGNVCCRSSDLTIPCVERFNSESRFNP